MSIQSNSGWLHYVCMDFVSSLVIIYCIGPVKLSNDIEMDAESKLKENSVKYLSVFQTSQRAESISMYFMQLRNVSELILITVFSFIFVILLIRHYSKQCFQVRKTKNTAFFTMSISCFTKSVSFMCININNVHVLITRKNSLS